MKTISESEYESELKKIQAQNLTKQRRLELKKERKRFSRKRGHISTSKIVMFCVILICVQIIAFVEYATITLSDTSAMYALIGIPTTLVPTICGYYNKSKAENTAGGITYDMAMKSGDDDREGQDVNSAVG